MARRLNPLNLLLLILSLALVSCIPATIPPSPTALPEPTNTPIPTSTATATPSPSPPTPTQVGEIGNLPPPAATVIGGTPVNTPEPSPTGYPDNSYPAGYVEMLLNVNVRSGPGTDYPYLGLVYGGNQYAIYCIKQVGGYWWVNKNRGCDPDEWFAIRDVAKDQCFGLVKEAVYDWLPCQSF